MSLKYINEADFKGKNVLARFDFNIPLNNGKITDTTRLDEALPTIQYLIDNGASKIILMSHLGRPKGKKETQYSLEPVATYLATQLGKDVILTDSAVASSINTLINLPETKIVLLENLRFHSEEEKNDLEFAKKLSQYGDIYVNDAFGAAHRKHASIHAIVHYFGKEHSYGGFLLKKEIDALSKIIHQPKRPFVAIVGGAKIADKIKTLEHLLVDVDHLLIGGAMAYPFLKAKEIDIGDSLCTETDLELAKKILRQTNAQKVILPVDHMMAKSIDEPAQLCPQVSIPDGMKGLDVGPKTIELFAQKLKNAQTIFWNGPLGLFENKNFAEGTFKLAKILSDSSAFTLVGGGDSVSAVKQTGLSSHFSHISTGGGASLEFIEQGQLPGIQALKFGV